MDKDTSKKSGVSLSGVLAVVFIVLKLTGVIAWSWVWVLAPIWIPIALSLVVLLITLVVALITALVVYVADNVDNE